MKKMLFFIVCLLCVSTSNAQTWQELYDDAESLWGKNWATCAEILEKALPLAKKNYDTQPKDTTYSLTLNSVGACYFYLANYSKAEFFWKEYKNVVIKTLGTTHPEYANACNSLGALYQSMGQYTLAEPLLKEAKETYAKTSGTTNPEYAVYCNNLGALYHYMGLYTLAEPLYKEAREVHAKTLGTTHPEYANASRNLGTLYQNMGQYKLAESLLKEAKEIQAKALGTQHPDYATSCSNLGALYQVMSQYTSAEGLFKEAKEIYAKTLGTQHPYYPTCCNNLGNLYFNMRQYTLAEPLYKEAQEIRAKTLGVQHPSYANTFNNLGTLYQKMGKNDLAEPLFHEAAIITLTNLQRNFKILTETQKENYVKINQEYFQDLYNFTLQSKRSQGESYNMVLATKGLIAGNTQSIRNRILNSTDSTLKNTYLKWQNINKKIAKASETPMIERNKKGLNLDSLQKIASEYEKTLNTKSEEFKALGEEANVRYTDIQKRLTKNEACIEMVRVDIGKDSCGYMALVLRNEGLPQMIPLDTLGNKLESTYLTNYRRNIKNKLEDKDSYHTYWKSIAEYLSKNNIKKAYFSPDGVYNQININTLYNPIAKKHVLDEIEIINVTNTKEIALKKVDNKPKNAFLVGRPDYKAKTKLQNTERGETLNDLQGTEVEVNNIEQTSKKAHLTTQKITAQFATKDTILHQISPSILHIATHGFFKPNTELATQRMLQSGLILAGAEVLSAFEAMEMDLRGTELVCLSACETGLGEIKAGEGVYGLQRAFRVAGAKAVMMSLWKVNDEATQELMSNFYTNWLEKKQSKRTAFKNAQNGLRKKYQNPYYWGAFVMVGE